MRTIREIMKHDRGLTLIELLVTVAVIVIVFAIAIPVVLNITAGVQSDADSVSAQQRADFSAQYFGALGATSVDDGTYTYAVYGGQTLAKIKNGATLGGGGLLGGGGNNGGTGGTNGGNNGGAPSGNYQTEVFGAYTLYFNMDPVTVNGKTIQIHSITDLGQFYGWSSAHNVTMNISGIPANAVNTQAMIMSANHSGGTSLDFTNAPDYGISFLYGWEPSMGTDTSGTMTIDLYDSSWNLIESMPIGTWVKTS